LGSFSTLSLCLIAISCRFPGLRIELFESTKVQRHFFAERRVSTADPWSQVVIIQEDAFLALGIYDNVRLTGDLKVNVQVHDVHDQVELVEVDLVFEQRVAVTRNFDVEFGFQVLGHFWVLQSLQIVNSLEYGYISLVVRQKVVFVLHQEVLGLGHLFEDHVEEKTNKDWKEHFVQLSFDFIQAQLNEGLERAKAFLIVACLASFKKLAVNGSLLSVLTLAKLVFIVSEQRLQVAKSVLIELA
jgi:hypothetical protein